MRKYDNLTKFQTNINFIKECLIISLREIFEYKINFYSSLSISIFTILTTILSLLVFKNNFYFFNLNIDMILFFVLFSESIFSFFLIFAQGKTNNLFQSIIRGKINIYLARPINVFLCFVFNGIRVRWLINSLFYFIFILIFLKIQELSFSKFFLVFSLSFIIGYFFISFIYFLDSLSFFYNTAFFIDFVFEVNVNIKKFPPTFFDKFEYKNFLYLFPLSLFVFPTLYYFDFISLNYLLIVLIIVLILCIILTFLIVLLWKKGLKNYSAFG